MIGILTITINPAIDINTTVDNVDVERKLRCSTPTHEPGVGGLNVSRAIHKLGGDSTAFYTCGGLTGDMLQNLRLKNNQKPNHSHKEFLNFNRPTLRQSDKTPVFLIAKPSKSRV